MERYGVVKMLKFDFGSSLKDLKVVDSLRDALKLFVKYVQELVDDPDVEIEQIYTYSVHDLDPPSVTRLKSLVKKEDALRCLHCAVIYVCDRSLQTCYEVEIAIVKELEYGVLDKIMSRMF